MSAPPDFRRPRRALAAHARPQQPALAEHARPLPRLAVRNHAAADAGGDGARLLRALPRALSRRAGARRGASWTTCWRCGAAWATTAARATCTAARRRSSRCTAANFRAPRRRCRRCPASAARPPRRSPRSASASASPSSTATSSACSRACSAFGADLASAAQRARAVGRRPHALLPRARCRRAMPRYTQGLMDLGATVCLPRNPSCLLCPVRDLCVARARRRARRTIRSRRASSSAARSRCGCCSAQARDGAVWLEKRPATGIWAGLYCLPVFESRDALQAALPAARTARCRTSAPFMHVLTHKDLHLHPVAAQLPPAALRGEARRLVRARRMAAAGVAGAGAPAARSEVRLRQRLARVELAVPLERDPALRRTTRPAARPGTPSGAGRRCSRSPP